MADVLQEITSPEIDRDHVVRRIDDWVNRIDALYGEIGGWLPPGWIAYRKGTVRMREELMQKFDVPTQDLPILRLSHEGKPPAHIEPRGLWIIGANGRLDLFSGSRHYVIVDVAENFQRSDWRIAPLSDRGNRQPLNRETLAAVL